MSIFDDIAGALSSIFGGGAQQSSSSNSGSSGSRRSDYGDNDSLATNNTGKKTTGNTNKQVTSNKTSNSSSIVGKDTYNPKLGTNAGYESSTGEIGSTSPGYMFSTINGISSTQPNDYVINYDHMSDSSPYRPKQVDVKWARNSSDYKDALTNENKEAAKKYARSQVRSAAGDNDSLPATQDNASKNKTEADENGHTIYRQGNKFGRGVADAYSAATTGDSRVSMDNAVADDAYKMTGDERYNRNSDKYYKKHEGEKGYEGIDPYNIDDYMDFGEFVSGTNEDGTPVTRKQTRQYLMDHPALGAYVLSSNKLEDAIKNGQLDKAAYKNFVVDYVNDMYDNPRSVEDMQNAYVGSQQDGTTSDFYNQWAAGNSFIDGGTDFGNYLQKLYADSLLKNGAHTDYKWYNNWANDLVKNGKYTDGNLATNPEAVKDSSTYKEANDAYKAATATDSTLSDEQKKNALANYDVAGDKLASELALMGQLVAAGQNPGSLNLDSIDNSVIRNYNKASNYGKMDKLTDLGTSDGYYASDKYTPEALDANGYGSLGAQTAREAFGADNVPAQIIGGVISALNPSIGLASAIGNAANYGASNKAKEVVQAIDNAEDQGSALYDRYRSQTGTDDNGTEYPGFSRAYDSGVSVASPRDVKNFYKNMGSSGLSVYNTNDSSESLPFEEEAVKNYLSDKQKSSATSSITGERLATKYLNDPSSLTDDEQKQLAAAMGVNTINKANSDINPIITSLMARAYAAPTDSPSSLVYTFTPDNLKTALSTGTDENQG